MQAQLSVPDLLENVDKLSGSDFEKFLRDVLSLRAKRVAPVLMPIESELLKKVYQKWPSSISKRYDILTTKRKSGTITESEYDELLELVKSSEQYNVERMKAIIDLALIRKVSVPELMKSLDILPLSEK